MPALREVQSSLMHALMRRSDGSAAQALLRPGTVPSTQRRLQIYRNNLFETRIAAIGAVYPVVARLVGTDFIRCAAKAYSQLVHMRCGDLHEFDPRDSAEHLLRCDPVEHDRPEDRADLVAQPGQTEQHQRQPKLLRDAESGDRHSPQRRGDHDTEALPAHVPQRSREQRDEQGSGRRGHVQVTDE